MDITQKIRTKVGKIISQISQKQIAANATIEISKSAKITNCQMEIGNQATLRIGSKCKLHHSKIRVADHATLTIGEGTTIFNSNLEVRYPQACLHIGEYCYVGSGCRFYADESIILGNYNMIAYDCLICDTQVHNPDWRIRRKALTQRSPQGYPGLEPKPRTAPLIIGDDCFFGKSCVIKVAKSSNSNLTIGDRVVIGASSVVGIDIPDDYLAAGNPAKIIKLLTKFREQGTGNREKLK